MDGNVVRINADQWGNYLGRYICSSAEERVELEAAMWESISSRVDGERAIFGLGRDRAFPLVRLEALSSRWGGVDVSF